MAKPHSKDARVFLDIGDLSGASTMLSVKTQRAMPEVTAFGDSGRIHQAGPSEDEFDIETIFDDTATSGVDVLLEAMLGAEKVTTLWPYGDAIGAKGWGGGTAMADKYALTSALPEMVVGSAHGSFNAQAEHITSLQVKDTSAISATQNGTSIDDSSSSSSGGAWYYHVFTITASGGNAVWKVDFQHSTNNSTWADKDSVYVSAVGAARREVTGTINRYVRQVRTLDASSGTIISSISYIRD